MTTDGIVDALLAVAAGDHDGAVRSARAAAAPEAAPAGSPRARLAQGLLRHLEGGGRDVYGDPAGFERFLDRGGNVGLYRDVHAALAACHARQRPGTVLDLGCGDGRLSVAALQPGVSRIELVEPSADLLAAAQKRLAGNGAGAGTGVAVAARGSTAQEMLDGLPDGAGWDTVQCTFALHALPPEDRARALATFARRARHLLLVEFDVPPLAVRSSGYARHAVARYTEGIAEYPDDDLVVDGFLVPVLVGQFDPGRPRHTWEQPIDLWIAGMLAAGFAEVRHHQVSPYWWAPAHLVEATSVVHLAG
jgi:SAM-dependent methyltransferase